MPYGLSPDSILPTYLVYSLEIRPESFIVVCIFRLRMASRAAKRSLFSIPAEYTPSSKGKEKRAGPR